MRIRFDNVLALESVTKVGECQCDLVAEGVPIVTSLENLRPSYGGKQFNSRRALPHNPTVMKDKPGFIDYLEKKGVHASVVSAKHVDELGAEIRALHESHTISDQIFDYGGASFRPHLPKSLPNARSIIIMATPQPMLRVTFHHEGKTYRFNVPPTYFDGYKVTWQARRLLKEAFKPESYRFVRALVPVKLLAVRSGLALYGKTNITYVPEHGSFHRLTAFYSDYDSPVDNWREKLPLPLCATCKACLKACPTGAIQSDRFLICADRCLTFLNEKPSKKGFPRWLMPSAHNALVGCMRCQLACPYNKGARGMIEDRGAFSEKETAYLLKGVFKGKAAAKMQRKLSRLGLDLSVFPRNLKVLLESESRGSR